MLCFVLQLEIKMLAYLLEKFSAKHRVSVERVVSGTGLANVSLIAAVCLILS